MVITGGKRLMMVNQRSSLAIEISKYKQRSVSAVRDFPPDCGPNASRDDFRGSGVVSHGDNVQKVEHSAGGCLETENKKTSSATESHTLLHGGYKCVDVAQTDGELGLVREENAVSEVESMNAFSVDKSLSPLQGIDKSMDEALKAIEFKLMNDDLFDSVENLSKSLEPAELSEELLPKPCSLPETLQGKAGSDTDEVPHETLEPSKDLMDDKTKKTGDAVIPSTFVSEKIHYHTRRVSAIRDFPPGCGPHTRATNKHFQLRPPNSEKQDRMNEPKSIQQDKSTTAYDRKFVKGASKAIERKAAISYRDDKWGKKRKLIYLGNDTDLYAKRMSSPDHAKGRGSEKGLIAAADCSRQQGFATSSCVVARYSSCEKGTGGKKLKLKSRYLDPIKKSEVSEEQNRHSLVAQSREVDFSLPPVARQQGIATSSCVVARYSSCEKGTGGKKLKLKSRYLDPIKKSEESEEQNRHSLVARSREVDFSLPPVGPSSSVDGVARNKVRETLRLFQAVVRKLSQEQETNPKGQKKFRRVDLEASVILKKKGKYSNAGQPIIGHVPGVEVGDEFHYRVELMIIGLHRPPQGGIDSVKIGDWALATSVVDSGGYDNKVDDYDVWVYTGHGGNSRDKGPEDQKLERGNLALKNSCLKKNHVRVIRGVKDTKPLDDRRKVSTTFTYFGLYTVERYWPEVGHHGKKEYKFELKRVPGQRDLPWKEVKNSKKLNIREGRCVSDISKGKEKFPICAVNTIDDEKPPSFTYITRMTSYPCHKPLRSRGCDCINGCCSSECSCIVKNGGVIPYDSSGAIVVAKPIVYECGPSCKCRSSCQNRVSQNGMKFQLEIFKTRSRGWGVRSLSSIPSGSFICEYTGELLEDNEAEKRTGNDEYLFDIGQNCNDHSVWDGLSGLLPDASSRSYREPLAGSSFTIDAAKFGNVGRFINHSCSPNLYAQNVLYDHADTRMPHIMFFAVENIPPMQELTWHYNYKIGQVYDEEGNVKVKHCYCGSSNCSRRMY